MKQYNFILKVLSSNRRKEYTIKVDENGLFSCSCPSWIFNQRGNRTCKHIDSLRENINLDKQGRLIVGVDSIGNKIPMLCQNYPNDCKECEMRFICWTTRGAEFDLDNLRESGIYKR